MAWMLAGRRDFRRPGGGGSFRAQGLALVWARVMRVWLDDDDPGLARTMAALDKRLREAERAVDAPRLAGAMRAPARGHLEAARDTRERPRSLRGHPS